MPRVRPLSDNKEFFCPECTKVQDAENTDTRVESMRNVSIAGNDYKIVALVIAVNTTKWCTYIFSHVSYE